MVPDKFIKYANTPRSILFHDVIKKIILWNSVDIKYVNNKKNNVRKDHTKPKKGINLFLRKSINFREGRHRFVFNKLKLIIINLT